MPTIILPVVFESKPDETIQLFAYAFTRSGKLLDREEVKNQKATFKDMAIPPEDLRFFILPAQDADPRARPVRISTLEDMKKFQAYEPILKWDKNNIISRPIPDSFPKLWRWIFCRVAGKVVKRFNILGLNQDRGLCRARVHICEVDRIRFWIDRIPDHIILRIPDIILKPEIPIRTIPIPDPGPLQIKTPNRRIGLDANLFGVLSANTVSAMALQSVPQIDRKIRMELSTKSVKQIRSTLLANFNLFHPYFCYHPFFWPFFYRYGEITTEYTDMNGRFESTITYLSGTDIPDLYFWVEYFINGVWTTVYKPSVPCNTFWDYKCGTEVTLRVSDDRVRWECSEILPGEVIWLKSVGHGVSVSHIKQTTFNQASNNAPVVTTNRIGMTDASVNNGPTPAGDFKRPIGGSIYLLMQFSSGLPNAQASYFRWKYCKTHEANLDVLVANPTEVDFIALIPGLAKQYSYEYLDLMGYKHISYDSVNLGPVTKGTETGLYQIPPVHPTMAPFNIPAAKNPNWDQNTFGLVVDTSTLQGDGLYEFRLEVFNAAGVQSTDLARQIFQTPEPTSFSPSVFAPDEMLANKIGSGSAAKASGMKLLLRIDNQKCEGGIYKIKKNGNEVSTDCCGFVNYGNVSANMEIGFKAFHPHDLAEFSFSIKKGTCSDPGMSNQTNATASVAGNSNGYVRDMAGIYTKTFHPPVLLGICNAGGKAAFAESLDVLALATDGNSRLSAFDAYDLVAFALEP